VLSIGYNDFIIIIPTAVWFTLFLYKSSCLHGGFHCQN
jgi:hypothetical protein